jgi:hypothetical protein
MAKLGAAYLNQRDGQMGTTEAVTRLADVVRPALRPHRGIARAATAVTEPPRRPQLAEAVEDAFKPRPRLARRIRETADAARRYRHR